MNLIVLGRVKEMKPGTKASVGRKTVTAGKSKSLPRGRATSEESRDTCQVCSVADDSASSVRVECRGAAVGSISGQEVPPVAFERIDEEVDAFISTRLLLTPQQQESLRAVLVREEVWDMWAMRHMTEQDWADVGLTIGLRKRIRSRLALG